MNVRVLVVVLAFGVGALAAGGIGSCSSTIPAPPTGIDEPPTLRISSPFQGACIAIPSPLDAFVPVTVDLAGSFYLRPPGMACANVYNCGYLRLYLDGAPNNTSATATINANLGELADPYGTHTLTVELVWDFNDGGGQDMFDAYMTYDGSQIPDVSVAPLSDANVADPGPTGYYQASVTIRTAPSCTDAGTGGTGGGGGAGGGGSGVGGADAGDGGPPDAASGTGGAPPSDGGGTGGAPSDGGGAGGVGPADASDEG